MRNSLLSIICLIGFFVTSCTDDVNDNINNADIQSEKLILTPEEYVSIAYDNPTELSENDIRDIMNDFRNIILLIMMRYLNKIQPALSTLL